MSTLPNRTQVHIDTALTNFGVQYISTMGFVGEQIPTIPVQKQSNYYFVYDDEYFRTIRAAKAVRGPGSESAGGGFKVSKALYMCDVFSWHQDVDEQTVRNADAPVDLMRDAARLVAHQLALVQEQKFVDAFIGQSAWGGSGAPSTTWDDDSSTPIEDIRDQSVGIIEKTGFKPNAIFAGAEVHQQLVDHPDVLDRIKHTQKGVVTADLLAQLFEVDRYFVMYAADNSSDMGATASYDYIGNSGKNLLLCHLNPGANLVSAPTALVKFAWSALGIDRIDMPLNKATRIEGEVAFDMRVTASDLGYEFTTAVA